MERSTELDGERFEQSGGIFHPVLVASLSPRALSVGRCGQIRRAPECRIPDGWQRNRGRLIEETSRDKEDCEGGDTGRQPLNARYAVQDRVPHRTLDRPTPKCAYWRPFPGPDLRKERPSVPRTRPVACSTGKATKRCSCGRRCTLGTRAKSEPDSEARDDEIRSPWLSSGQPGTTTDPIYTRSSTDPPGCNLFVASEGRAFCD